MKLYVLFLGLVIFSSCKDKTATLPNDTVINNTKTVLPELDVDLKIYDFDEFQNLLNKNDDKVYVINFWATWCGPCVKELPYFEKLNTIHNEEVEVILVSLDFPHVYDSKLKPFIKKKNLQSRVVALNAPNENEWINAIDTSWSGSIPATIIYNKHERKFFERSFTFEELQKEVKQLKL